ncbi:MAG: FecR family protein [Draconibacterium sp.]
MTEQITPEEEVIFQLWFTQSGEHVQFYQQAEHFFIHGSQYIDTNLRTEKAWKDLDKRLHRLDNTYRTRNRVYKIVASMAASLLIVFFIHSLLFNNSDKVAESVLMPGKEKATLILNDGKEVVLDKNQEIEISNKQRASVEDNTLKYKSSKVKKIAFNTLKVNRGETFKVKLSDGTTVYLNSQTVLRYPVQFNEEKRIVELVEGEAFFAVARDTTKVFQLISNNQTIEVLGTSFNISAYSDEDFVRTTLVEGKVKIHESFNTHEPQFLLPNEQFILDKKTGSFIKKEVNPVIYTSWKDGIYYFDDATLEEIMKTLSRWYNYNVMFSDSLKAQTRFGGKLKRMESIDKLLSMIENTNNIHFEITDNTIKVY